MAGENVTKVADAAGPEEGDARQKSTIAFPYSNLGDALEVATTIHSNVGTGDCDDAQLSAWMGVSAKSSGFRGQISAARLFGLIETTNGRHKLTALGRAIIDPQREREARVRAFMNVPLYSVVFEKYKGGILPPAAAFERDIVGLGVIGTQKERARQVFERSAEQAGFFESGRNRLVMPGIASREESDAAARDENGTGGKPPPPPPPPPQGPELHPFIQGLLKTLPDPDGNEEWPLAQRVKWLQTAANIFDLIYKGEGGIRVEPAQAYRSPRPD